MNLKHVQEIINRKDCLIAILDSVFSRDISNEIDEIAVVREVVQWLEGIVLGDGTNNEAKFAAILLALIAGLK